MRKVAATILALALATTHGLLEEGGASKGLRGAEADSSLERAAVGRKLDFYQPYECKPPGLGLVFRTPPGCGLCSDGAPGGPCTQSDEDLNHLMTIGPTDGAEGPNAAPAPATKRGPPTRERPEKNQTKTQNKIPSAVPPPRWRRPDCY